MLKHTIVFTDFDGVETSEDHYFNMSPIEATRFQNKYGGDLIKYLKSIGVEEGSDKVKDPGKLTDLIEDIVMSAYGARSEDGRKFIKNDEVREEFKSTLAYDQLIVDLLMKENVATQFMSSIISGVPKDHKK